MMAMTEQSTPWRSTMRVLGSFGLLVVFAFLLGVIVGASEALAEDGADPSYRVFKIAVAFLGAAGCIWGVLRLKAWQWGDPNEPISPKTHKAYNLLLGSGLIGGVLGLFLAIGTEDPRELLSNGPMSLALVIPSLAVWLVIVPVISWHWHRNIDEHERDAYQTGGLIALYLYIFLAPAWWLAARGGLVPAPDSMVLYLIVLTVWGVGWFWRRYR